MIAGEIRPGREAMVPLRVAGPTAVTRDVEAVVDTGFTECPTLPSGLIAALQLRFLTSASMVLGDQSSVPMDVYRAGVFWHGQPCWLPIHQAEGDPVIGMALLYGSRLTMDVVDGGPVTIEPLP